MTDPAFFDQKAYIPQAGTYVIRFTLEDHMTVRWVDKPSEDWPEDKYPSLEVRAELGIAGQGGSGAIVFKGSEALTKIGTDGLYSFWSVLNYLYFSKDKGLRIAADTEISSPNGDYKLTINDTGISIKGDVGSDLSNSTVSFTVAGTRVNIATGEQLSVAFGKIARWFADLKTAAFTGSYNDLTNRPASLPANGGNADTVDGKHASDFIPATDKGSAGGVAELDTTGKVPAAQLPLGETSGTAYPGNKGKQNADDIAALKTDKLDKTGDASDTTVVFTPEAGDPASGGKLRNIVGRVVKKISDIVSGAIAVGVAVNDSAGLHIANNYLRRSYVRPGIVWNSIGWRRIYIAGNADHPGGTVMLNITNLYSNTPPQLLSLLISTGSGGVVIQQFNASYNVPIGKVRVCRKSNTPWCVDVYCNDARANYIYANQCGGDGYIVGSEMADPSIEGYTVTEYEIKAGDRLANVSQLPKVYVQSAEPAGAPEGSLWAQNVD